MMTLKKAIDAANAGTAGGTAVSDFVEEVREDSDSLHVLVGDLNELISCAEEVRDAAQAALDSEPDWCSACDLPDTELTYSIEDNVFYCPVCGAANMPKVAAAPQPNPRDNHIFVKALAAMDMAEEINGPEGDDYVNLMRAIEDEARTRRETYERDRKL